jgi:hypothetical protein
VRAEELSAATACGYCCCVHVSQDGVTGEALTAAIAKLQEVKAELAAAQAKTVSTDTFSRRGESCYPCADEHCYIY